VYDPGPMSEPRTSPRVSVSVFGLTDMGKVRTNNEDAFLVANLADAASAAAPAELSSFEAGEGAVILAVSDGMGGADAGEVASALVVESLRRAMLEAKFADGKQDWDAATRAAVESANREVWSASREPGRRGMGATVTAVCVQGDHAHIAEVGDSRAYLLRTGRIRQVTRDQSFVQYLVDAGALKPEEAANYPMKNVVLQAMGQNPDVQVALGRLELRRGDKLLLCSDGLSGKVKGEEMLARVQQAPTLEAACRSLVDLANERGGEDNITVVLARLDGEGLSVPKEQESLTQTFQVLAEYKAAGAGLDVHDDEEDDPDHAPPAPAATPAPHAPPASSSALSSPRAAAPSAPSAPSAPRSRPARDVDLPLVVSAVLAGVAVGAIVLLLQRL
jgi:serine/threonine protein phosphatase PrpC